MNGPVLPWLHLAGCTAAAFFFGAGTIWLFGTGWLSRLTAIGFAVPAMFPAIREAHRA